MIDQIQRAIQILNAGDVVGMPTETVYGLAARIDQEDAIKKVFQTKERPFFDPLIVHVASVAQAKSLVQQWPAVAEVLTKAFWPGPLTLVLEKNQVVSALITSGLQTVGIRMPNHPLALELIEKVGHPLAAPSANKFGKTSPTTAAHVQSEFVNENVFVVDGGSCQIGLESTVLLIDMQAARSRLSILREGFVTQSMIESTLKKAKLSFEFFQAPRTASPGHMKHHYMPSAPLVIVQNSIGDVEELKNQIQQQLSKLPDEIEGVRIIKPRKLQKLVTLQLSSDPSLAAREFYGKLREVAEKKPDLIYFMMPGYMQGEPWAALLDRIRKAASLII